MFKLPICPHCGTVYRYKDTKAAIVKKENECYHCHKSFRRKLFPYILVDAIIIIAVSIGLNLLLLSRLSTFNVVPLFLITIALLVIGYLLIPFFTKFIKSEEENKLPRSKH